MNPVDLLIIGGGPAGLSAAINGASEGLTVRIMDNGAMLGGQARESSAIENYPGFPDGITGDDLMSRFVRQAHKFNAGFFCPCHAAALDVMEGGRHIVVKDDDYQLHVARAVLLSLGVNYRKLSAQNIGLFMGRGVYYGVPQEKKNGKRTVAVIGGANAAGQAVVNLASNPKLHVRLFVRKTITTQMSAYLVERIKGLSNVTVEEHCEVEECHGDSCLRGITYLREGEPVYTNLDAMYIFIGALPKTMWLPVALDKNKFILTDDEAWTGESRAPLPFETSMPGVFAAGDVRSGSVKRVATAIGEGAAALQMVHKYLGQ